MNDANFKRSCQTPQVLALIPARGGSKGLPRKNVRLLRGKPLVAYSIEHALASNSITRVIVTTDDQEIADVAREHGAEVPFLRPAELAEDMSLDIEFYTHALRWLDENEGYRPDAVVSLRPTHPVRSVETIDRAIHTFFDADPEVDSLRSVILSPLTPFKMWRIEEDGLMRPVITLPDDSESHDYPRQRLPLVYRHDGYIDVVRPRVIFEQRSTCGARVLPFLIEEESVDIDYEDALLQAEQILESGGSRRRVQRPPS